MFPNFKDSRRFREPAFVRIPTFNAGYVYSPSGTEPFANPHPLCKKRIVQPPMREGTILPQRSPKNTHSPIRPLQSPCDRKPRTHNPKRFSEARRSSISCEPLPPSPASLPGRQPIPTHQAFLVRTGNFLIGNAHLKASLHTKPSQWFPGSCAPIAIGSDGSPPLGRGHS